MHCQVPYPSSRTPTLAVPKRRYSTVKSRPIFIFLRLSLSNKRVLSTYLRQRSQVFKEGLSALVQSQMISRTVVTKLGPIVGQGTAGACVQYLGVPYAASTAGSNRYRPPQPRAPWTE